MTLGVGIPGPRALLAITLLGAVGPHPTTLEAQSVQGQVVDATTSQAVPQVTVLLLRGERGDTVVIQGLTGADGRFALEAPKSGAYRLRTLVIGYQPVSTPVFDLRASDPPLAVEVRVSRVAVLLAPLVILSPRAPLLADRWLISYGYYDRARHYGPDGLGAGRFLDRAAIARTGAFSLPDLLRFMPRVAEANRPGEPGTVMFRSGAGRCNPSVFLDGAPLYGGGVGEGFILSDLAAIEVYPGTIAPPEYLFRNRSSCGAIVLWTGTTGHEPEIVTTPPAEQLELDLTLSADTVGRADSVAATLVLANRADTSRTVCIIGSRFTLGRTGGRRDLIANVGRRSCVHPVELAPQAASTWREVVSLKEERAGALLLQKRLDLQVTPCSGASPCRRVLVSGWHVLVVANPQ